MQPVVTSMCNCVDHICPNAPISVYSSFDRASQLRVEQCDRSVRITSTMGKNKSLSTINGTSHYGSSLKRTTADIFPLTQKTNNRQSQNPNSRLLSGKSRGVSQETKQLFNLKFSLSIHSKLQRSTQSRTVQRLKEIVCVPCPLHGFPMGFPSTKYAQFHIIFDREI